MDEQRSSGERLGTFEQWQRQHPSTQADVIADLARRATGAEVEWSKRLLEGYSNEVHRVHCTDGQGVVVRILRFDDEDLAVKSADEAYAIRLAREAGVPAPEILLLDTVGAGDATYPVMVQRAVPGRPLGEVLRRLSPDLQQALRVDVGAVVARLNAITVDLERDWTAAMRFPEAARREGRDTVMAGGFTAAESDRMLDLVEQYAADSAGPPWVLCHGDLSTQHIYAAVEEVTDDHRGAARVSGLIDFGDWLPGAPAHDLALRVRSPELPLAPVLVGYDRAGDRDFRRRLDLHTLMVALDTLHFGVTEQDTVLIDRLRTLIRTVLQDLRP